MITLYYNLHFCTIYFSFALAGHRGTCLRPLHIFALLCFALEGRTWKGREGAEDRVLQSWTGWRAI